MTDLEFFDRKGFVPSSKVKSIDSYLKESEIKLKTLQDFEKDPHEILAELVGKDIEFELKRVANEKSDMFYKICLTEPSIGVYTNAANFKRILTQISLRHRLALYGYYLSTFPYQLVEVLSEQRLRTPGGTIIPLKKDVDLCVPLVRWLVCGDPHTKKWYEDRDDDKAYVIFHETTHCVRQQLKTLKIWRGYSGLIEEEVATKIAYLSEYSKQYDEKEHHEFIENCRKSNYYSKKTSSFFEKCVNEGLNPFYLFLRSNPSEYGKSESIKKQLVKSNKPGFQIMACRLSLV